MSTSDSSTDLRKLIGYSDDLEDRTIDFEPVPYTFRIPNNSNKECSIQSPPHWLLLDHTIAVVWTLFSVFTPNKALDIDDLKWAHEFLKEIRNAKGENPPDVKTCLTEIQNRLIALYAQLTHPKQGKTRSIAAASVGRESNDDITGTDKETASTKNIPLERQKTTSLEASKVPRKREVRGLKTNDKESLKDLAKSDTNAVRRQAAVRESPAREAKKSLFAQHKRLSGAPTKATPSAPVKRSEATPKKDSTKKDEGDTHVENFFTEVFQRNKNTDRVLGPQNLARKKPSSTVQGDTTSSREQTSDAGSRRGSVHSELEDGKISLQFKRWTTDEELNEEEQAYRNLKNEIHNLMKNPKMSKDEVLKFLSDWREEQMERLQSELKRLNSIEEFMKSLKMEGFVPYVSENLALGLASATNKKKSNKAS